MKINRLYSTLPHAITCTNPSNDRIVINTLLLHNVYEKKVILMIVQLGLNKILKPYQRSHIGLPSEQKFLVDLFARTANNNLCKHCPKSHVTYTR